MSTQLVQRSHEEAGLPPTAPSRKAVKWAGWICTILPGAFLILDSVLKFVQPVEVVEQTVLLGYEPDVLIPLGITLLISTILYLIPQTAVLGAILLTGYLGGAVATHVRIDHPLFTHTLFPVYLGILIWLGLYLRDPRLRDLVPLRQTG